MGRSALIAKLAGRPAVSSKRARKPVTRPPSSSGTRLVLITLRELRCNSQPLAPDAGRLSLVVLSGCTTLGEHATRWGPMGLARRFVGRGAAVLVTLWPAEDRLLADLTVSFHRGVLNGLAASASLRLVQLDAIAAAPTRCCDWASLQLIGDMPAASPN